MPPEATIEILAPGGRRGVTLELLDGVPLASLSAGMGRPGRMLQVAI